MHHKDESPAILVPLALIAARKASFSLPDMGRGFQTSENLLYNHTQTNDFISGAHDNLGHWSIMKMSTGKHGRNRKRRPRAGELGGVPHLCGEDGADTGDDISNGSVTPTVARFTLIASSMRLTDSSEGDRRCAMCTSW